SCSWAPTSSSGWVRPSTSLQASSAATPRSTIGRLDRALSPSSASGRGTLPPLRPAEAHRPGDEGRGPDRAPVRTDPEGERLGAGGRRRLGTQPALLLGGGDSSAGRRPVSRAARDGAPAALACAREPPGRADVPLG